MVYFFNCKDFLFSKFFNVIGFEGFDFEIEVGFIENFIDIDDYIDIFGWGWGVDLGMFYWIDFGDGFYCWEFGIGLFDFGGICFS